MVAVEEDLLILVDRVLEDLVDVVAEELSTQQDLSPQVIHHNLLHLVSLLLMDLVILANQETLVAVAELVLLVVLPLVKTLVVLVSQPTLQVLHFLLVVAEEVKHSIQILVLHLVQVVAVDVKDLKVNLAVMALVEAVVLDGTTVLVMVVLVELVQLLLNILNNRRYKTWQLQNKAKLITLNSMVMELY